MLSNYFHPTQILLTASSAGHSLSKYAFGGNKRTQIPPDSYKALHLTHWLLFWELGLSSAGPLLLLFRNWTI